MVPAVVFLTVVLFFAIEAGVLWLGQLHQLRRERDHWARHRPVELYDWQKELDL